jgi:hypothetical protein
MVVGGDKLDFPDDPASPASGLLETKLLLNSVISDASKGARFMGLDIQDYFLASPMHRPEYMRIHLQHFSPDIIEQYDLLSLVADDGYVYIEINKGMYGVKQAALMAYEKLVAALAPHGYRPCKYSLGIWEHKTKPTKFCLCVDDFGVKYFNQNDADHLIHALQTSGYAITIDMKGENYCGLKLEWNYDKGYVDISMPGYVKAALHKFQHKPPSRPCRAPHKWTTPVYGQITQFAKAPDSSGKITLTADITQIQSIVGTFLYYARAVDSTMLPALNEIGTQQSAPTKSTKQAANTLMDFAATYPDAKVRFYASDMILHISTQTQPI